MSPPACELTDRLYNVIAMADTAGNVIELVRYSAYGVARHTDAETAADRGDVNGDGTTNFADQSVVLGAYAASLADATSAYKPDADLNADGVVNFADLSCVLSFFGATYERVPDGDITKQTVGNTVGYCGYLYDPAVGMYLARLRWYDAGLGRWMSRDPIEYAAGSMSVYEYVGSAPLASLDPLGLFKVIFKDTGGFKWTDQTKRLIEKRLEQTERRIQEMIRQLAEERAMLSLCVLELIGGAVDELQSRLQRISDGLASNQEELQIRSGDVGDEGYGETIEMDMFGRKYSSRPPAVFKGARGSMCITFNTNPRYDFWDRDEQGQLDTVFHELVHVAEENSHRTRKSDYWQDGPGGAQPNILNPHDMEFWSKASSIRKWNNWTEYVRKARLQCGE